MNDEQLIDAFNQQVGVNAWGTARSLYLAAIHNEFIERGYNYSDIGSKGGISFADKIRLEETRSAPSLLDFSKKIRYLEYVRSLQLPLSLAVQ